MQVIQKILLCLSMALFAAGAGAQVQQARGKASSTGMPASSNSPRLSQKLRISARRCRLPNTGSARSRSSNGPG